MRLLLTICRWTKRPNTPQYLRMRRTWENVIRPIDSKEPIVLVDYQHSDLWAYDVARWSYKTAQKFGYDLCGYLDDDAYVDYNHVLDAMKWFGRSRRLGQVGFPGMFDIMRWKKSSAYPNPYQVMNKSPWATPALHLYRVSALEKSRAFSRYRSFGIEDQVAALLLWKRGYDLGIYMKGNLRHQRSYLQETPGGESEDLKRWQKTLREHLKTYRDAAKALPGIKKELVAKGESVCRTIKKRIEKLKEATRAQGR